MCKPEPEARGVTRSRTSDLGAKIVASCYKFNTVVYKMVDIEHDGCPVFLILTSYAVDHVGDSSSHVRHAMIISFTQLASVPQEDSENHFVLLSRPLFNVHFF